MIWFVVGICLVLALVLAGFGFLFRALSYDPPPLRIIFRTLKRDLRNFGQLLGIYVTTYYYYRRNVTIWKVFESLVQTHPNKACFIMGDKTWTYQEVEHYCNQIANAFARSGYKKGDVVALFMHNRPEYVCIWLGLSRLGVITSFINTNLRSESLAHCINAVPVRAIIFDDELAQAVGDVHPLLQASSCELYCLGGTEGGNEHLLPAKSLEYVLANESKRFSLQNSFEVNFLDKLLFICTSGTTGLPKPALVRNSRYLMLCLFMKTFTGAEKGVDIIYNTLPMYHSSGGVIFTALSLSNGNTAVIRKKFSASKYWEDASKYKVTIGTYIGELLRFLLRQPENSFEKTHNIHLMIGSGLRHQIWEEFQERFRIPKITEFYGSTEGTAILVNDTGKAGPVGFIPLNISRLSSSHILKVDEETMEPIRREDGLCTLCKPGEPGIVVGKDKGDHPMLKFDGYASKEETEKKIVRDCFRRGDRVYFSGDKVIMDEEGYVYFVDRTGDTFRWRGENVSTTEVEITISKILNLTACVVYGVQIPGTEGRAGMAAVEVDVISDMKGFHKRMTELLPNYAVPIFLRFRTNVEVTGTFRLKKVELRKDGFDIRKVADPIFFLDPSRREYVQIEENLFTMIMEGKFRF